MCCRKRAGIGGTASVAARVETIGAAEAPSRAVCLASISLLRRAGNDLNI